MTYRSRSALWSAEELALVGKVRAGRGTMIATRVSVQAPVANKQASARAVVRFIAYDNGL